MFGQLAQLFNFGAQPRVVAKPLFQHLQSLLCGLAVALLGQLAQVLGRFGNGQYLPIYSANMLGLWMRLSLAKRPIKGQFNRMRHHQKTAKSRLRRMRNMPPLRLPTRMIRSSRLSVEVRFWAVIDAVISPSPANSKPSERPAGSRQRQCAWLGHSPGFGRTASRPALAD